MYFIPCQDYAGRQTKKQKQGWVRVSWMENINQAGIAADEPIQKEDKATEGPHNSVSSMELAR